MKTRAAISFRWLSLASHLLVMVLPLALIVASGAIHRDLHATTERALVTQSSLLATQTQTTLRALRSQAEELPIEAISASLSDSFRALEKVHTGSRLLNKSGIVIATSGPGLGADLSKQPEVQIALSGVPATQTRKRQNSDDTMPLPSYRPRIFTATPVILDGVVEGVVVVASTPRGVIHFALTAHRRLSLTLFISLFVTVMFAWFLTKRTTEPLIALTNNTKSIGSEVKLSLTKGSSISEIDQLAEAYNQKQSQLSSKLAYITELSASIAHEFKTPITSIRAIIELVRDDPNMPLRSRTKFLTTSTKELNRLTRLVDGLLQLARAEETSAFTLVSLDDVAMEVARRMPNTEVIGHAGIANINRESIEAALTNLVSNGWEHGEASFVTVRCWQEAEQVAGFDVTNDGNRINPTDEAELFSRFFTTNRENGGTGLGLAIARAAAHAHGGTLILVKTAEHTTFRITLPTLAT